VNQLGESIVAMLIARRNLLAAEGKLGPIAASLDISQLPLSKLASSTEPTAGLTLSCTRVSMSDFASQRVQTRSTANRGLHCARSNLFGHRMVWWQRRRRAIDSHLGNARINVAPVLDRSVLIGPAGTWDTTETVQLVPDSITDDAMFRLWAALQHKMRLKRPRSARASCESAMGTVRIGPT